MAMRSPKKAAAQLEILGGAPRALRGEVFSLVVCGSPNMEDGWIFSDFLGFSSVLREQPGNHTFYSCFDLTGHFASLKKRGAPIKDIKFGKYGPEKKYIFSYEKSRFEQCPPFWFQFEPEKLLDAYHAWIEETKQKSRAGDVVNIVFACHGTFNGSFEVGKQYLHTGDLIKRIEDFPDGVQVNVVSTSCFAGHLADQLAKTEQTNRYVAVCETGCKSRAMARSPSGRWRTGRFANAFVESLLKAVTDFHSPNEITWTVEQHNEHIRFRLRNITPNEPIWGARFHHAGFQPDTMPLQNIILRDNSEENNDEEVRPKEIDWKAANEIVHETFARTLTTSDHSVAPSAMAVAQTEGALCNINQGEPSEMLIYDEFFYPNTNWKIVLTNMYWRSFRQAAMWHIYLQLLRKGLVNTTCLELPIDLHETSPQTNHVSCLISCFEVIQGHLNDTMMGKIPGQSAQWVTDTNWLATMIVRSGPDLDQVIKEISQSNILGEMCQDRYEAYTSMYPDLQICHDPKDSEGRMNPDGCVAANDNIFAFWLPHGLTNDPKARSARLKRSSERAWAIEKAFREVETPPLDILILDIRLLHLGSDGTSERAPPDLEHDVALHDHSAPD